MPDILPQGHIGSTTSFDGRCESSTAQECLSRLARVAEVQFSEINSRIAQFSTEHFISNELSPGVFAISQWFAMASLRKN